VSESKAIEDNRKINKIDNLIGDFCLILEIRKIRPIMTNRETI
jgi:hypothetical protein